MSRKRQYFMFLSVSLFLYINLIDWIVIIMRIIIPTHNASKLVSKHFSSNFLINFWVSSKFCTIWKISFQLLELNNNQKFWILNDIVFRIPQLWFFFNSVFSFVSHGKLFRCYPVWCIPVTLSPASLPFFLSRLLSALMKHTETKCHCENKWYSFPYLLLMILLLFPVNVGVIDVQSRVIFWTKSFIFNDICISVFLFHRKFALFFISYIKICSFTS